MQAILSEHSKELGDIKQSLKQIVCWLSELDSSVKNLSKSQVSQESTPQRPLQGQRNQGIRPEPRIIPVSRAQDISSRSRLAGSGMISAPPSLRIPEFNSFGNSQVGNQQRTLKQKHAYFDSRNKIIAIFRSQYQMKTISFH